MIVSDYNYGAAEPEIVGDRPANARRTGIPLIVDSRFRLAEFPGATAATPNQEEVEQISERISRRKTAAALRERLGYKALLVTCGNKGMTLFEEGEAPRHLEAVGSKEPVDVTGAGDTVIAAYALGLASGLSFFDAAIVANHAGGIVVMKHGTASVTADELIASLDSHPEDLTLATRTLDELSLAAPVLSRTELIVACRMPNERRGQRSSLPTAASIFSTPATFAISPVQRSSADFSSSASIPTIRFDI